MKHISRFKITLFIWVLILYINTDSFGQSYTYRVKIGNIPVTALIDGTAPVEVEKVFASTSPDTLAHLLRQSMLKNPVEASINAYLIEIGTKRILVDAGSGELMGSYGGKLVESLRRIGIQPGDITDILLTHVHVDHSGGLVVAGKPIFPNALIHVHQAEIDFWLSEENRRHADPKRMGVSPRMFADAQQVLAPYLKSGQVVAFRNEQQQLLPHISTILSSGHTPGHTIFVLDSEGERLYFWGDMIHVPALQFTAPSLEDHFDVDMRAGKLKREAFYQEAALQRYLIAGAHISFPGIGYLKQNGKGYLWVPIPFSLEGRIQ